MSARALPSGRTWMWSCPPCIDYAVGFDDLEDAQDAADDHNKHKHRGDNPDDDYWDRLREARHA